MELTDGCVGFQSMIELSRTQDEEVGDGTTSVIILAGEFLYVAEQFLDKRFHPTVICRGTIEC
jgi:T-complex protein 1 subunit gamma